MNGTMYTNEDVEKHDNEDVEKNEPPDQHAISEAIHNGTTTTTVDNLPPEAKYSAYTEWEKRFIVIGAAVGAIFSPLTVQIYLPALTELSNDLHVSAAKINLTVTIYMIFQGLTPMFIAGFADTTGRRPAYIICFIIYIGANIGLAESPNYGSIMGIRCLQAIGIAATQTLCQAVVADVTTSAERGHYIGIITLPAVLGPSLGPLIGGALAQYLGWRSIFWFLTICGGVVLLTMVIFFPETCRTIVGDGSIRPPKYQETLWQLVKDRHRPKDDLNTTSTAVSKQEGKSTKSGLGLQNFYGSIVLLKNLEFILLLLYGGLMFASIYAIATAMSSEFSKIYGFNSFKIGLMYLPMVGGTVVAVGLIGKALNWNYARHAKKLGLQVDRSRQIDLIDFPIEKARLEIAVPLIFLTSIVIIGWGWALESQTSVAVPCVLAFFLGISYIGVINVINALITDYYRKRAAVAVAANWLVRCLIGAAMSGIIEPLIKAVGAGWAYTIVGALYVVFSPVIFLVMWKGMKWRQERRKKEEGPTRGHAQL